eukprot:scaffold697295_cov47-Attheya_sp.AAC.1
MSRTGRRQAKDGWKRVVVALIMGTAAVVAVVWKMGFGPATVGSDAHSMRRMPSSSAASSLYSSSSLSSVSGGVVLTVFSAQPSLDASVNRMRAMVGGVRMTDATAVVPPHTRIRHYIFNTDQQASYLQTHGKQCLDGAKDDGTLSEAGDGGVVFKRFQELVESGRPHLAQELWKYCALQHEPTLTSQDKEFRTFANVYLDTDSPLLMTLEDVVSGMKNVAVLGEDRSFPRTLHGSFLVLKHDQRTIARHMVKQLMETPDRVLDASPLLLPSTLYETIIPPNNNDKTQSLTTNNEWNILEQRCHIHPLKAKTMMTSPTIPSSPRMTHYCPVEAGYCCEILDTSESHSVVLMTKHPLLPYQVLPTTPNLPRPFQSVESKTIGDTNVVVHHERNLPFITTVREEVIPRPDGEMSTTPSFFDTLLANDCLPSNLECNLCLRNKKGATCKICAKQCPCYCKSLCKLTVEPKFVAKEIHITPPLYRKDPNRLIPRIVHQTWFEPVTPEKYPNMSRLIESWKRSGWEHRFYTDESAGAFLSMHFPPEVREAFDTILPVAFKADLFRYCVLLINGGIYADMDVLLEANLEAIGNDVGFMTPMDEPGKLSNHRMCLWNGFIASAPGHPYLVKVVESVVNGVRNRFTSVDTDHTLCPNPELSVSHAFDTLFTAGPCILGASLNRVLGRHPQTQFEPGDIPVPNKANVVKGATMFVLDSEVGDDGGLLGIPGRTIILKQDKWDMGAHRFTWVEQNLVVAATDFEDYDDRKILDETDGDTPEHYSKTHAKVGVYGLEKLYVDRHSANEDVKLLLHSQSSFQHSHSRQAFTTTVIE